MGLERMQDDVGDMYTRLSSLNEELNKKWTSISWMTSHICVFHLSVFICLVQKIWLVAPNSQYHKDRTQLSEWGNVITLWPYVYTVCKEAVEDGEYSAILPHLEQRSWVIESTYLSSWRWDISPSYVLLIFDEFNYGLLLLLYYKKR